MGRTSRLYSSLSAARAGDAHRTAAVSTAAPANILPNKRIGSHLIRGPSFEYVNLDCRLTNQRQVRAWPDSSSEYRNGYVAPFRGPPLSGRRPAAPRRSPGVRGLLP